MVVLFRKGIFKINWKQNSNNESTTEIEVGKPNSDGSSSSSDQEKPLTSRIGGV
jgi:hypothetical protein